MPLGGDQPIPSHVQLAEGCWLQLSNNVQPEINWSSFCYLREETTAAVTSVELSHFGGSPAVEMMDFVFHPFTQNDLLF